MIASLPPLKRILAIHDMSGVGKCSLTVALPVISAAGVECSCLPTALLSTHSGDFYGFTKRDLSDDLLPIAQHWKREGVRFDGIYTGYLASARQTELVEEILDLLATPETLLIVDPVMAENGKYYSGFDGEMCVAFRRLCARADIITPNMTEAAFLTDCAYHPGPVTESEASSLLSALCAMGTGVAALTGVLLENGEIGNAVRDAKSGKICFSSRRMHEGVFYGTGDIFASALSALLIRGAPIQSALELSTTLVDNSITRSVLRGGDRRFGVDFEGALPEFLRGVQTLFE